MQANRPAATATGTAMRRPKSDRISLSNPTPISQVVASPAPLPPTRVYKGTGNSTIAPARSSSGGDTALTRARYTSQPNAM